jgi:hypothetical protein
MGEPDRTRFPVRRARSQGLANRTLEGSEPYLDLIGHVEARREAPNVLSLMDDARSGNGTRKVKEW